MNVKSNYIFSLEFEKIGEFEGTKTSTSIFDLAISYQFDKVIVGQGYMLKVFQRAVRTNQQQHLKLLFQVCYGDEYDHHTFHCMKIIKENQNEEFLYVTDTECHVLKIKVADLMNRQTTLVWKSKVDYTSVVGSNISSWGLDIFNGRVYVMDNGMGIKVFDCATGFEIIHSGGGDSSVKDQDFPNISAGFGLHFFSEKEMLISNSKGVELFEKVEQDVWKSVNRAAFPAYSVFYEELSNLIYFSERRGSLYVIRKDTLQVVKIKTEFHRPFGMIVDRKSGFLYVCDSGTLCVNIFQ